MHLVVEFLKTGHHGPSPTGPVAFYVDDEQVAAATITVQPAYFSLSGEGTNIGRDRGQPVSLRLLHTVRTPRRDPRAGHLRIGDDAAVDLARETATFRRD